MTHLSNLDATQTQLEWSTEHALVEAMNRLKAINVPSARAASNKAASAIRHLERIHRQRRGAPRAALWLRIRFFSMWQQTVAGEIAILSGKSAKAGYALLDVLHVHVREIVDEYPDSEDFKRLLEIVNTAHSSSA